MKKCFTPCIYYREILYNNNCNVKLLCDIKEGCDIKKISEEEANNCIYFKSFKDLSYKLI